eukprot:SAG31_NODE_120_length_23892_cov_10.545623_7_plen_36_part_00
MTRARSLSPKLPHFLRVVMLELMRVYERKVVSQQS